jgi:serine/threonine-protein kinase RsbW
MGDVTVSVPARPDFVHVLRSVVASVGALFNFPYDAIDDLRIAVDEACAHLLTVRSPATLLCMRIDASDKAIEIVASTDAEFSEWPPSGARQTLTWQVLSALADDAEFERTVKGPGIRFTKRLPV